MHKILYGVQPLKGRGPRVEENLIFLNLAAMPQRSKPELWFSTFWRG